jgi:hypothetical protein
MFFDKKYFKYKKIVGIALASLESYFRNESNDTNNVYNIINILMLTLSASPGHQVQPVQHFNSLQSSSSWRVPRSTRTHLISVSYSDSRILGKKINSVILYNSYTFSSLSGE